MNCIFSFAVEEEKENYRENESQLQSQVREAEKKVRKCNVILLSVQFQLGHWQWGQNAFYIKMNKQLNLMLVSSRSSDYSATHKTPHVLCTNMFIYDGKLLPEQ